MKKILRKLSTFNFQRSTRLRGQSGVTLMLTIVILSNILMIALVVGIFSLGQLNITAASRNSAYAIFAGTTGLERAFYQTRVSGEVCDSNFSIFETMANGANYNVVCAIITGGCGATSDQLVITSAGSFRGTTRTVEASWCQ